MILDDIIIDSSRAEYVFGTTQAFNAVDKKASRMVNALPAGSIDRETRSYLVTYVYVASDDAKGEFQFGLSGEDQSVFLNSSTEPIDVGPAGTATIAIR
jgi:hypothetical protein